ncbi:MAG: hypothetical protein HRF43_03870 [Phycisphaerae bacterium]
MSPSTIELLVRGFRRSVAAARAVRILLTAAFCVLVIWALQLPEPQARRALGLLVLGGLVLWAGAIIRSVRLTRELQTGNMLMAMGRLDDAEACLGRVLRRFSLSPQVKFLVFQQLAALFFQRQRHDDVVIVCHELLRQPIRRLHGVWLNTRLLLADVLLLEDRVAEAYGAMRPVYDAPLTLTDRMKLLPIQLRYELASNHAESAVGGLAEKVRIAELLESPAAGLVHALLAEACRRLSRPAQQAFLAERARLYCDLAPIARRYPVIAPIAAEAPADPG